MKQRLCEIERLERDMLRNPNLFASLKKLQESHQVE